MTPSSLKKADLVEMAKELGLDFAPSSRKDKIEAVIRDHLLSHRDDVNRDKRFQLFSIPSRVAGTRASSGTVNTEAAKPGTVTAGEAPATGSDVASADSEAESSDTEEGRLNAVRERVDAGIAHVKQTLSSYQYRTQSAIASTFSSFQHQVSTVAATNISLILAEYVYLIYTSLPSSFFGTWQYGVYDAFDSIKKDVFYFTAVLIALPLLITFVMNFTKMDSIRRKKHVYLVDPILFGVTRFYIATFLFITNFAALRRYAILAGSAGISSALIGVYASLLQTS